MQKIVFKGTVFSGKGEGRQFIELPWVKSQIEEKLGFTPYSGTLNIRLTKETSKNKKLLENTKNFKIYPEKGYCTGLLIKSRLDRLDCAIILPQMTHYPSDVLEVISKVCLRDRLKILDGDAVTVSVDA